MKNKQQKKIRRNVDLSKNAILVLQWYAVALGHGTIKPYLENYLEGHASRILSRNPSLKSTLKVKLK